MLYTIFSDNRRYNIFKKHVKLIFLYGKQQANLKKYAFIHVYSEIIKLNGLDIKFKALDLKENKTHHISSQIT